MATATMYKGLAVCLTASALLAAAPLGPANEMTLQPESKLWVDGTSTVRGFTCSTTGFTAKIESEKPQSIAALMLGTKVVRTVVADFPTDKLDCKNGTMNEHMRKAIKAEDNPTIEFRLGSYDMLTSEGQIKGQLRGTLVMGGVEKPVVIDATAKPEGEGKLRVTGTTKLRMTEWGLKPPTLMFGTMKVNENVQVGFDLLLKD
ncbi:MAG: YceI family protein [Gemmatimonadaceae bacterium]|nr:YceI family protein [Gemmatimonadaceae bacterium]NUQ92939.1 YceI family protein [Gemmatimonadaceae bacterium]NUR20332.1 YceI family protein [Gemmatimonadaceae bacterium]NUS98321.1 YceI family protein [Gemmatimonadaceae bacterium]